MFAKPSIDCRKSIFDILNVELEKKKAELPRLKSFHYGIILIVKRFKM
jgi:hypothetical protein